MEINQTMEPKPQITGGPSTSYAHGESGLASGWTETGFRNHRPRRFVRPNSRLVPRPRKSAASTEAADPRLILHYPWIMDINQPRKFYPGMWRRHRDPDLCCIYRVPNYIRDVNPEAYTPQIVIIGPLHRSLISQARRSLDRGDDITYTKSMGYLNMEEHKKFYLEEFARRFEGEKTIDALRIAIKDDEEIIRASYSESTDWIQSQEFVEMVLHDSVFILEFVAKYDFMLLILIEERVGDPLIDEPCLYYAVKRDLMLLENQLPYFILEKLFDEVLPRILPSDYGQSKFRELIITCFGFKGKIKENSKFRHITDLFRCARVETLPEHYKGGLITRIFRFEGKVKKKKSKFRHFTDLFRCGQVETLPKHVEGEQRKLIQHMYSASKLDSGGVKFKAKGEGLSLNVTFKSGCLKMPCLMVGDESEMTLRNIMALEQCHYPSKAHVCSYVLFLDDLIDTEKDVDLLVEKGIIKNVLGQPASVARMVNKLGLGIFEDVSFYSDIAVEVNSYYSNPVKGSQAVLKRVYFSNLWTGTATIAATFLLLMTLIQTVASIIQVMQNASK